MSFREIVQRWRQSRTGQRPGNRARKAQRRRLRLEVLEDRTLLSAQLVLEGPQTIVPGTNINMTLDSSGMSNGGNPASETAMAIDPTNPLHVVGFTHDWSNSAGAMQVFYSIDGGQSWSHISVGASITTASGQTTPGDGITNSINRYDPTLQFDADGNLFIAYGVDNGSNTTLEVARGTFQTVNNQEVLSIAQPRFVDRHNDILGQVGLDKWELTTGLDPSTGGQAVYVAYTRNSIDVAPQQIVVTGSNDGGQTWLDAVQVATTQFNVLSYACPAVGPNGELYVSWLTWGLTGGGIHIVRDLDGLWAQSDQLGHEVDVQGFQSRLFQTKVDPQPHHGINNGPVLSVDTSNGPFRGRLYIAWVDTVNGSNVYTPTDIFLEHSDDNGQTWLPAGNSGLVVDGGGGNDFLPWMDVDPASGSLDVMFYSDNTESQGSADVVLASSSDGGATFAEHNLSSSPSNAWAQGNPNDFGDYTGMAVLDGTVHGFWADNRVDSTGNPQTSLTPFTANAAFQSITGRNTLVVQGDDNGATDDTIVLRTNRVNPSFLDILVNGQLQYSGLAASVQSIAIDGGQGNNTVDIEEIPRWIAVTVTNASTVNVGDAGSAQGIQGTLTLVPGNSTAALTVDDSADTIAYTNIRLTATELIGPAPTVISFPAGTLSSLTVKTGDGGDVVNIEGTAVPTNLVGTSSTATNTVVNVGNAGSVQGILGTLTIENPAWLNQITVDDSADTMARMVTLSTTTSTNDSENNNDAYGQISGLPCANILYEYANTASLTLDTGDGGDTVNVQATGTSTYLIATSSTFTATTVNVGDAGSVQGIQGTLTIENPSWYNQITVDDSADMMARTVTLNTTTMATDSQANGDLFGKISGLAADIYYEYLDTRTITVDTGDGGDTVNVQATGTTTNLVGTSNTFTDTTVNVGNAGSVQGILGTLTIENPREFDRITVDDSADMGARTVTLSTTTDDSDIQRNTDAYGLIHGLAPADIYYEYGDTVSLTVDTGDGGDTVNVQATGTTTNLVGTSSHRTDTIVNVGNAGSVLGIQGTLSIENPTWLDQITVDDSADSTARTVTLIGAQNANDSESNQDLYGQIQGLAPLADINYELSNTRSLTINGGANDQLTVDLSAGNPIPFFGGLTFNGGSGTNALTVQSDPFQYTGDAATGPAAGSLAFSDNGIFTVATITYTNVQTVTDIGTASARYLIFTAPGGPSAITIGDGPVTNGLATTQVSGTTPGTSTASFATLVFADRSQVNVNSMNPADTITLNTVQAAAGWQALTINAAPITTNFSPQSIYVLSTASGVAVTINAANGAHNIYVGLSALNVLGTAGNPLDGIQGAVTVNGQSNQDILTLDDSASTAVRTYTVNATSISASAVNGVTPALISWQGLLSTVILAGSTAADTYQLGSLPSDVTSMTVTGAPAANTVQSLLTGKNTWQVFSGGVVDTGTVANPVTFEAVWNLTGGPGADDFQFMPSSGHDGSLSGVLDGGGGGDTLDVSQSINPVTVNLADSSATNVDSGALNGVVNILHAIGNDRSTTLVGPNAITNWSITGTNQGNLTEPLNPAYSFTFLAVPNLTGGTTGDAFQFSNGAAVTGVIDGGDTIHNTLDYSLYTTGVTVDLQAGTASHTGGIQHIQNVIGTPGNDTIYGDGITSDDDTIVTNGGIDHIHGRAERDRIYLYGNQQTGTTIDGGGNGLDALIAGNITNTWVINGHNAGTVNERSQFTNIPNVYGGLHNDTFRFQPGGLLDGYLVGNQGANTLDFSQFGSPVSVRLADPNSAVGQSFSFSTAGTTFTQDFAFIQTLIGNAAGTNTLIGTNQAGTWQLYASGYSYVRYGPTQYQFRSFQSLVGGSGVDTFRFGSGDSVGHIDGGGAPAGLGDWLDYSAYGATVAVDLSAGSATGVTNGIVNIQNVLGSRTFANTLIGNAQGNILVGGSAADQLTAGAGSSLLIGGGGSDTVTGGPADDILISGTTVYDQLPNALMAILSEWQSNDPNRVTVLRHGVGPNHVRLVWGSTGTVRDDGVPDQLTGGAGRNWFFANYPNQDSILDYNPAQGDLLN